MGRNYSPIATFQRWSLRMVKYFYPSLYPRSNGDGMESAEFTLASVCPTVRPSVCPSVDKVSGTLKKNIASIHFALYGVSLLTPIHFRVPVVNFGPLMVKHLVENGVFGVFCEKMIRSINLIAGIQSYGVRLLTPIHFRVPASNYSSVVPNICLKGFRNCLPHNPPMGNSSPEFVWKPTLQNRNLCWIFLDKAGSDQIGGILSPFMGTACFMVDVITYPCWN